MHQSLSGLPPSTRRSLSSIATALISVATNSTRNRSKKPIVLFDRIQPTVLNDDGCPTKAGAPTWIRSICRNALLPAATRRACLMALRKLDRAGVRTMTAGE